jgi:hypothetical protein
VIVLGMTPRTRPVSSLPTTRGGLIHLNDARRAGWSTDAVRHAVDSERILRRRPGLYAAPEAAADPGAARTAANLMSARAAAEGCDRAVISHASAALGHELPTVCRLDRACLTVQSGTALRRLARVHLHRATLWADDIVIQVDFPITSPARTVLDLAREHGVDAGVAALDQALRRQLVSSEELTFQLEHCRGWPGYRRAAATVALADGLAESPLESLSRLRIAGAGLPAPELQRVFHTRGGRFVARCDFYWPQYRVVGEADGNAKYDAGREAIVAERRREQALRELGLEVVRWEWADLRHFEMVATRLRTAFARHS